MTDTLITYPTAELAKEKGFKIAVGAYYTKYLKTQKSDNPSFRMTEGEIEVNYHYIINNGTGDLSNESYTSYAAPTQSLLQRWLREVHKIDLYCTPDYLTIVKNREKVYDCVCVKCEEGNVKLLFHLNDYMTYEAALEKGLFEALKLI